MSHSLLLCLILVAPLALSAQAPPTIAASLAEKHVGTSLPELIGALRNPDPQVRSMAAMELASEGHKEEAASLRSALDRETDLNARVGIARALAVMGDSEGEKAVTDICQDKAVSSFLRIAAASSLSQPREECARAIASELSDPNPSADPYGSLLYLNQIAAKMTTSPELSELLVIGARNSLKSEVPPVRQEAVKLILRYHLTRALPALREASSTEKDPNTQTVMRKAITALS